MVMNRQHSPLPLIVFLLASLCSLSVAAEPLTIRSSPSALIVINGVKRGKTPVSLRATPGSYRIELRRRGYLSWVQVVVVPPHTNTSFDVQLQPSKSGGARLQPLQPASPVPVRAKKNVQTGLVYLMSTPQGAVVQHQGKVIGRTPLLTQLPVGVQAVVIRMGGYASVQKFLTVRKKMLRVRVSLSKSSGKSPSNPSLSSGKPDPVVSANASGGGQLLLFSKPSATVTFDGKVLGQTPLVSAGFRPGRYLLVLRRKGYQAYKRWLVISPGQAVRINALLIPRKTR